MFLGPLALLTRFSHYVLPSGTRRQVLDFFLSVWSNFSSLGQRSLGSISTIFKMVWLNIIILRAHCKPYTEARLSNNEIISGCFGRSLSSVKKQRIEERFSDVGE